MNRPQSFAIWITGLPASGKSTIVSALKPQLEAMGLAVEVLESDEVRRVITPTPTYSEAERDLFYRALAFTGQKLVAHGVTVVFDATASRRLYRDFARSVIPRFIEVVRGMSSHDLHGARPERDLSKGPVGRISHRSGTPIALRSTDQPGSPNRHHHHSLRRRSTPDLGPGQSEIPLAGC